MTSNAGAAKPTRLSAGDDDIGARQVPPPGGLNIDHVAHFVPNINDASAALDRLGFTLTPFSSQSHRLEPGGPLVPAGTGNRCVMLERGYLEFLTPTGDTPVAEQLRAAIQRYVGVQLIAFGTAAPQADHARLAEEGFEPLTPVALQRPITTPDGEDTARFTVVRVPPGKMAEGRIQFCQQHTPALLWQARWLEHANGARALCAVLICVADPGRAAQRYSRYTGVRAIKTGATWTMATARGSLIFLNPETLASTLNTTVPALPWIAGYVLETSDLPATRDHLVRAKCDITDRADGALMVTLPAALGGILIFQQQGHAPLNLD